MIDKSDIDRRFTYYRPVLQGVVGLHEQVRAGAHALADQLNELLPDGREKSLAITHLEEVVMWGNAAIARHYGSPRAKDQ